MLTQQTIEQLKKLKLTAITEAAEALERSGQAKGLTNGEYVAIIVDSLYTMKMTEKIDRLASNAHMEVPEAFLEDLCIDSGRELDAGRISRLATGDYISKGHNIVIQSAAGGGKSFMGSAFANAACRQFVKVEYLNYRDMVDELLVLRTDPLKHKKKIGTLKRIPR